MAKKSNAMMKGGDDTFMGGSLLVFLFILAILAILRASGVKGV